MSYLGPYSQHISAKRETVPELGALGKTGKEQEVKMAESCPGWALGLPRPPLPSSSVFVGERWAGV